MTFGDLLFLPPLLLAVAIVVGTAGRQRREILRSIRRTFTALLVGMVAVGLVVRLIVILFA